MPRIRSIKPEFWASEDIASVSRDARLLFIGLWTFADDSGNGPASLKGLKMKVFPGDGDIKDTHIEKWLKELSKPCGPNPGLISLYCVESLYYYHVTKWTHQRIDKPQPPKYPKFEEHYKNGQGMIPPDRIGEDGIGKDEIKRPKKKDEYSEDFETFWKSYPRKVKKPKAWEAWQKHNPPLDKCLKTIEAFKKSEEWKDPKFIPHPTTWLNAGQWDDELPGAQPNDRSKYAFPE